MIHINVKRTDSYDGVICEVSTDGAGWLALAYFNRCANGGTIKAQVLAERYARTFADGARYAGAEVRMTSCGAELTRV